MGGINYPRMVGLWHWVSPMINRCRQDTVSHCYWSAHIPQGQGYTQTVHERVEFRPHAPAFCSMVPPFAEVPFRLSSKILTRWAPSPDNVRSDLSELKVDLSTKFWLVLWNMNFIFPYSGNNHPNWRTHIFQRGRFKPPIRWVFPWLSDMVWYYVCHLYGWGWFKMVLFRIKSWPQRQGSSFSIDVHPGWDHDA